jgi:hypothetical protein
MMPRTTPVLFVDVEADLVNLVSVDRGNEGRIIVTLGYGSDCQLCLLGAASNLRYILSDVGRQLDQLLDGDNTDPLPQPPSPVVGSGQLVTGWRTSPVTAGFDRRIRRQSCHGGTAGPPGTRSHQERLVPTGRASRLTTQPLELRAQHPTRAEAAHSDGRQRRASDAGRRRHLGQEGGGGAPCPRSSETGSRVLGLVGVRSPRPVAL